MHKLYGIMECDLQHKDLAKELVVNNYLKLKLAYQLPTTSK